MKKNEKKTHPFFETVQQEDDPNLCAFEKCDVFILERRVWTLTINGLLIEEIITLMLQCKK